MIRNLPKVRERIVSFQEHKIIESHRKEHKIIESHKKEKEKAKTSLVLSEDDYTSSSVLSLITFFILSKILLPNRAALFETDRVQISRALKSKDILFSFKKESRKSSKRTHSKRMCHEFTS